jgi:hypothetical protein
MCFNCVGAQIHGGWLPPMQLLIELDLVEMTHTNVIYCQLGHIQCMYLQSACMLCHIGKIDMLLW